MDYKMQESSIQGKYNASHKYGCPVCLPTRTHAGPASAHCRPSAPREAGEASRHPWVGGRPSDRPQCPYLRAGAITATSVQGVCGRCHPGPIARLWDPWGPQSPSGRGLHPPEAIHTGPGLATPFLPRDGPGGHHQQEDRAAAPVGVFSRGTTRISGSLSCGAREVRSP